MCDVFNSIEKTHGCRIMMLTLYCLMTCTGTWVTMKKRQCGNLFALPNSVHEKFQFRECIRREDVFRKHNIVDFIQLHSILLTQLLHCCHFNCIRYIQRGEYFTLIYFFASDSVRFNKCTTSTQIKSFRCIQNQNSIYCHWKKGIV